MLADEPIVVKSVTFLHAGLRTNHGKHSIQGEIRASLFGLHLPSSNTDVERLGRSSAGPNLTDEIGKVLDAPPCMGVFRAGCVYHEKLQPRD